MNIFNRWFLKKMKYCLSNSNIITERGIRSLADPFPIEDVSLRSKGIRFTLYKANGGIVIETDYYNDKKDERINSLHVCTDPEKLGETLSQILTLETLKM
jgi:hypothetical protein